MSPTHTPYIPKSYHKGIPNVVLTHSQTALKTNPAQRHNQNEALLEPNTGQIHALKGEEAASTFTIKPTGAMRPNIQKIVLININISALDSHLNSRTSLRPML